MVKKPEEIADEHAIKRSRQMDEAHKIIAPDIAGRKAMAILARDGVVTLDGLIAEIQSEMEARPETAQGLDQACLNHLYDLRDRLARPKTPR